MLQSGSFATLRSLAGRALRRLTRRWRPSPRHDAEAWALAAACTCSRADLRTRQQHPERVGVGPGAGWCNWYLPAFDHVGYGGIMTILRLADHLHRRAGLRQRFLICGATRTDAMAARITAAFPGLRDAPVLGIDPRADEPAVQPADYSFSTLWTTAYVLLKVRNTALKFSLIQDWEPLFYPAGSTSAQAELTYDFGFLGVANSISLRRLYEERHGGVATHFDPQIDPAIFFGAPARGPDGPRRLFVYARPKTPRNGFELAGVALHALKRRLGPRIDVVAAGAAWNPRDYGLTGVVRNLGLLEYAQTAALYRSCHVGLAMMMTRHPSYLPLELMACGALVVSNENPSTRWLLQDDVNCLLAPATAPAITERLAEAIERYDDFEEVRRRGHTLVHERHADWDGAFDGVWRFMREASTRVDSGRRQPGSNDGS